MMKSFLRTVLVQNRAEAADRSFQEDLPVNPLSMILFTLRAQNAAAITTGNLSTLAAMITSLGVVFRGQDVIRGSLTDLAYLMACVTGMVPWGVRSTAADDAFISVTFPLCLGRRPFNTDECFPATRRGDLILDCTIDVAITQFDTPVLQIETVELLDAKPGAFMKATTLSHTMASTGQDSVRLPIGNPLLGALLFATTVPTISARTSTWEQMRVKVDNVEYGYAKTNWDTVHGELVRRIRNDMAFLSSHTHQYDGSSGGTAVSSAEVGIGLADASYGYLDFDPDSSGEWAIDTAGRADVVIQRDSGVADAGRVIPVELVRVQAPAA